MKFNKYSKYHLHFLDYKLPKLLIQYLISLSKKINIIDIGCSDGGFIYTLQKKGFLKDVKEVIGVDVSKKRIENFIKYTGYKGIEYSGDKIKGLKKQYADLIINTQVLEHVISEDKFLKEIHRILKKNGKLFLSTVIKKKFGWYFYKNKYNKWVLETTHLREYRTPQEVIELLEKNRFKVINYELLFFRFSPINFILRLINRVFKIKDMYTVAHNNRIIRMLQKIDIPIPGYRNIELLIEKK